MSTHDSKILGLIPARKGSKGIPGKNMKLLGGAPLIRYTIEAALQSELLTTVLVSTDCLEIAAFTNRFQPGCAPLMRPEHLATDHSPMIGVVAHALDYAGAALGHFEYVVLLQPTCPFRLPGIIDTAIRHITMLNADSLITVRKIPDAFNPLWAYWLNGDSLEKALPRGSTVTRRQGLPDSYHRDGEIYIAKTSLVRAGCLTGGKIAAWHNDSAFGINIDTPADWLTAENHLEQWKEQTKNAFSY